MSTGPARLTPAERHRILVSWNDTTAPHPEGGVAELVAAQVARTPAAPAVTFGGGGGGGGDDGGGTTLTFAELDDRARRLAGRLTRAGVGPGVPVDREVRIEGHVGPA